MRFFGNCDEYAFGPQPRKRGHLKVAAALAEMLQRIINE